MTLALAQRGIVLALGAAGMHCARHWHWYRGGMVRMRGSVRGSKMGVCVVREAGICFSHMPFFHPFALWIVRP